MRSASAAGGNANADREYKRKRQIIVNDDVVNRVPGCQGGGNGTVFGWVSADS